MYVCMYASSMGRRLAYGSLRVENGIWSGACCNWLYWNLPCQTIFCLDPATRTSVVAVIANRTAYDVRYRYRPSSLCNCRGQNEYLLIDSFKLKSAFDARSLLLMPARFLADRCVLWLNDTS